MVLLSHNLSPQSPMYGGGEGFVCKAKSQISAGDSSNTEFWRLPNHIGTHIDAPKHFIADGTALTDFPPDFWEFQNPQILDTPCRPSELILPSHVEKKIGIKTDILLLKTGFEQFRNEEIYWRENPGLSPELAVFIRENFPSIRAIGFDSISASSFQNREIGRAAHRAFLGGENPVLLIEDMKFSGVPAELSRVLVAPIFVENTDGAPVTIFGWER